MAQIRIVPDVRTIANSILVGRTMSRIIIRVITQAIPPNLRSAATLLVSWRKIKPKHCPPHMVSMPHWRRPQYSIFPASNMRTHRKRQTSRCESKLTLLISPLMGNALSFAWPSHDVRISLVSELKSCYGWTVHPCIVFSVRFDALILLCLSVTPESNQANAKEEDMTRSFLCLFPRALFISHSINRHFLKLYAKRLGTRRWDSNRSRAKSILDPAELFHGRYSSD